MGILDNLERGLERTVRKIFSAGGSRQVKPVEIANTLRRDMDRNSMAIYEGRTLAPNVFTISFSPANFDQVQHWGAPLAEELCDEAIRHAREQGYTLQGAVKVTFIEDDSINEGDIEIESTTEASAPAEHAARAQHTQPRPGPAAPPVAPTSQSSAPLIPVVDIEGTRYSINSSSAVIGRSSDADITIADPGASRRHLEIRVHGSSIHAVDLGSTNGFYLNGHKVDRSAQLQHGDVLTIGRTRVNFSMIRDPHPGGSR